MTGTGGTAAELAAVVVEYHSGDLLAECVRALRADESGGPVEIVVVDNGDGGAGVDRVRVEYPDVTIASPRSNLGYARAANLGIALTGAPIVGVLNPDTVLAAGSGAAILAAFAADASVAVVGPHIVNPDGSTYPSARTAPGAGAAVGHALLGRVAPTNRFTSAYRQLDADPAAPRDVDWVSGSALWFRRSWLDRVGGWDERFFLFLEDVDVCRAIGEAGGRVRYEPAAEVMHVVGASRAGRQLQSIRAHHRAAYRYADKWWRGPRRLALPAAAGFLAVRATIEMALASVGRTRPGCRKSGASTG